MDPRPTAGTLRRPRLERWLDASDRARLTTLVAGPGFGKSTLLAAWAALPSTKRAFAIATCELHTEDDDADVLAGRIARALARADPTLTGLPASLPRDRGPAAASADRNRVAALAAALAERVAEDLSTQVVLVLDDVQELPPDGLGAALLEAVVRRAPPCLHLLLSSRTAPPFRLDRLRGRGELLEIDAASLAFTSAEVAELAAAVGLDELAPAVYELTGGWPGAVRLAVAALRAAPPGQRAQAIGSLPEAGGDLFSYLANEVISGLPADARGVLPVLATLGEASHAVCLQLASESVGTDGVGADRRCNDEAAAACLEALVRGGLLVRDVAQRGSSAAAVDHDRSRRAIYRVHALVRDHVLERAPLPAAQRRDVVRLAATCLERDGRPQEALRLFLRDADDQADHEATAALLRRGGDDLLDRGAVEAVARAAARLPARLRAPDLELLLGRSLQVLGDWRGATASYVRLADGAERLPPGLAWRIGVLHYLRGDPDEAARSYARAELDGTCPLDEAMLHGWSATSAWMSGDVAACRSAASVAFALAQECGDLHALALAHTALALQADLEGDRGAEDAHYTAALEAAVRCGDCLQQVRIRINRAVFLDEQGRSHDALDELAAGIALAEVAGFTAFLALGLCNRGETRFHLGDLDGGLSDLRSATELYRRMGSRKAAYPLTSAGDLFRERGDLTQARAAYEEALATAGQTSDTQAVLPAMVGLARVMAGQGAGPDAARARGLVDAALASVHPPGNPRVSLGAAWALDALGERAGAASLAREAAELAALQGDRATFAEALVLRAACHEDLRTQRAQVEEAITIFQSIEHPLGAAKAELFLADLTPGPRGAALRAAARTALHGLGVRADDVHLPVAGAAAAVRLGVEIRVLGRFDVCVDGVALPVGAWQSRKARDLLKLLVARRGRPVTRAFLMEWLWPGEDTVKAANRLSVALSTLRAALDPARRSPPDHYVRADDAAVNLVGPHVVVDAESFLAATAAGFSLLAHSRPVQARRLLVAAEADYPGEALAGEPFGEWGGELHEEARAAYLRVVRFLCTSADDVEETCRYALRLLEADPFDEQAHLDLVAALQRAGRHGEARRRYEVYARAMQSLDVEPAPFPATPLAPRRPVEARP